MKRKNLHLNFKRLFQEEGSFPMLAIIMIGLLIFSGLAFMKWGSDESWEATYEKYKLQAYYAAHAAIMDRGFARLRQLDPSTILNQREILGTNLPILNNKNKIVAHVDEVWMGIAQNKYGTFSADARYIDVGATGRVDFKDTNNKPGSVRDSLKLTVRLLSLSNFLYLTNIETTVFGEVIKFWHEDTLDGWVHSNDTIAIMENPVFYDHVSTTAPIFWQGPGFNPIFVNYPPMFEYREIVLPTEATAVRNAAASSGLFFEGSSGGQMWAHRLIFLDIQGWRMFRWPLGEAFPDSATPIAFGPPPNFQAFFVDGYLELAGIFRGQATVGAHGVQVSNPRDYLGFHCIRLIDDIRYYFASNTGAFNDTTGGYPDILGIISEQNITIANTWANGRQNKAQGRDIVITAALVALGESFSFEDQNEPTGAIPWEFWTGSYTCPTPPNSDERGDIYLHGAVTQYRRGYVHRSNHGGTGYGKQYRFDARLNDMSPPFFIDATDSQGNAHFEIISWGNR